MTNVPLMFQPLVKYVDFEGRARRSEFWLWVLFRVLLSLATGVCVLFFMTSGMDFEHPSPEMFLTRYFRVVPPFSLLHLALLLPSIAVGVRRLHDIGRTGWWLIMPHVVAIIGVFAFIALNGSSFVSLISHADIISEAEGFAFAKTVILSALGLIWLPTLVSQIVLLVFFVTDGTPHANRFGSDPKGRDSSSARIELPEEEDAY